MENSIKEKPNPDHIIDLKFNFKMISLGEQCYSRVFLERFHLYDFRKTRKVRMPFDGCVTQYKEVCSLLNNNFANVFKGLKSVKNEIITDSAIYNHEKTNNLDLFKQQMMCRTSQFNEELSGDGTIIFFITYWRYPRNLINIIRKKYPNVKFKIFCLNYFQNKKIKNSDFCKFISLKTPWKDYRLYLDHETECGQKYEKKVLKEFLCFLSEISGVEYDIEKIFSNRSIWPT